MKYYNGDFYQNPWDTFKLCPQSDDDNEHFKLSLIRVYELRTDRMGNSPAIHKGQKPDSGKRSRIFTPCVHFLTSYIKHKNDSSPSIS
jgi:hypothetical protein